MPRAFARDLEVGFDGLVDLSGDGSFEAAEDFFVGLLGGGDEVSVGLGAGVIAESDHGDSVELDVGLAVATAVESVPVGFA